MKQKIKIKVLVDGCAPILHSKGNWIDLRAAEDKEFNVPYATQLHRAKKDRVRDVIMHKGLIPLGVAMQLPKGMEAIVAPRSSTCKNFGITQYNSIGIIDNSYCGDKDQWFFPALAVEASSVKKGDRVCQFRIQPAQDATVWQKLKWLFSSGVKFEFVESLNNPNRGGNGSTGVK